MGGGLFLLNYVALYIQMFGAELTFDFGFFFFFFVSVAALWETRNYSQEIKMEKKNIYICYSRDLPHDLLPLPSLCI